MKSQATDGPQAPGQASIKTRRFSVSLVWIVPIVAVLVGISWWCTASCRKARPLS